MMVPTVQPSPTGPHRWDADFAGDIRTRRVVNASAQTLVRSQMRRTWWCWKGSCRKGCRSEDASNDTIDAAVNVDCWPSIRPASRKQPSMP